MEPITPPPFKFKNKALQAQAELILYNYELRLAVASFRKRWRVKIAENGSDGDVGAAGEKLLGPFINQELQKMLRLFNPPLPQACAGFIYIYAATNKVIPITGIPRFRLKPNQAVEHIDREIVDEYYREVAKIGYQIPRYDVDLTTENGSPKLTISIHEKLKPAEWQQLKKVVDVASEKLPRREAKTSETGTQIKFLSRLADLRRANMSFNQIAAKLSNEDRGTYTEPTLRKMHERAKALGL